jgi:hypothetical protein
MRARWFRASVVAVAAVAALGTVHPNAGVTVIGGSPAQRAMAGRAVNRFLADGLSLPPLQIHFHPHRSGCHWRLGYYEDGVASICGIHANQMSFRGVLHEMAHGWLDANLSDIERARFLDLRRLSTWNGPEVPWDDRGFEQAAEIMAWTLGDQGDGILRPAFQGHSIDELRTAYRVLTGHALPDWGAQPDLP